MGPVEHVASSNKKIISCILRLKMIFITEDIVRKLEKT